MEFLNLLLPCFKGGKSLLKPSGFGELFLGILSLLSTKQLSSYYSIVSDIARYICFFAKIQKKIQLK